MKKKLLAVLIVSFVLCMSLGVAACTGDPGEEDMSPRIEFSAETLELEVGQAAQITPVVKNAEGLLLWQSSAAAVASVDQTGLVTANAVGTAIITAFIDQNISNDITVTVMPPGEAASITFPSDSYTMSYYENLTLTPVFVQCSGTPVWTSSDPSVATVESDGSVIPHGFGTSKITVSCGNLYATVSVNVEESSEVPTLSLNRDEISLIVGGELSIIPSVQYNGKKVEGFSVEMISRNPSVAEVTDGKVTGIATGDTFITLSVNYRGYDFAVRSIPVSVKDDVDIILSQNELELYTKELASYDYAKTKKVNAEVWISGEKQSEAEVVWSSEDPEVASVTLDGTITAEGAGNTLITASYTDGTDVYTAAVNTEVIFSEAEYAQQISDLSETDSVRFFVPFEQGEILETVTIDGNVLVGQQETSDVVVTSERLLPYYGLQEVIVTTDRACYRFPIFLITKSISTMDELRDICTGVGVTVLSGYYVLEKDIIADESDKDFSLMAEWTGNAQQGFVGTFDGQGHAIRGLHIESRGLFKGIGATGVVKNLAVVDAGGTGFAIATECRGTVDNVFVSSASKSSLIKMSENCILINSFALLPAEDSHVVGTIFDATCSIKNVYAYADGMIDYTVHSQGEEPTIFASKDTSRLRSELMSVDFSESGYDTEYWTTVGGMPVFESCIDLTEELPEILLENEYSVLTGQPVAVKTSGYASVSLKEPVEGAALEDGVLTLTQSAEVTLVATGLWGKTSEKTVQFTVVNGQRYDRTDEQLFDYELGSTNVTFMLPEDISDVARLSIGTSSYFDKGDGFTVSDGNVIIEKSLLESISAVYGDHEITITDGTDYYVYTCSFVTKIINSYEDLESIRTSQNTLDGYYILGQSFNAGNAVAMGSLIEEKGGGNWTSDPAKGFIGIFDGRGHVISNLKLDEHGMFLSIGAATIRNLALVNAEVEVRELTGYGYAVGVFGRADCQSATFENIFVSTNARGLFRQAFGNVTLRNVLFVTSDASGYLFSTGNNNNNGSLTIENAIVVGAELFDYYGGTPLQVNTAVYESESALFEALVSGSGFAEWSDLFVYKDGTVCFGDNVVLRDGE